MRKFIAGPLSGTNIEMMPSKAATKLPDGTPIKAYNYDEAELTPSQVAHRLGNIDVHQPQQFILEDNGSFHKHTGPTIAQEWKILARGERPFYRYDGVVER